MLRAVGVLRLLRGRGRLPGKREVFDSGLPQGEALPLGGLGRVLLLLPTHDIQAAGKEQLRHVVCHTGRGQRAHCKSVYKISKIKCARKAIPRMEQ